MPSLGTTTTAKPPTRSIHPDRLLVKMECPAAYQSSSLVGRHVLRIALDVVELAEEFERPFADGALVVPLVALSMTAFSASHPFRSRS